MKWISIKDRLPESNKRVFVYWKNSYNNGRTSPAVYIPDKTILSEDFLDPEYCEGFEIYDEEKDCYWTPKGWYEMQYVTDMNYFISDEILYWMPLPNPPQDNKCKQ